MPIISNDLFTDLADRLAAQAKLLADAMTAAQAVGGGYYYPRIHGGVAAAGNYDVEDALIDSANDLDVNTMSGTVFPDIFRDMINAHEAHVIDEGASSLDAFLNTSGIDVDVYYEDVYYLSKGSHLEGRNVFSDVEHLMGTIDVTSSGVATFTDGEAVGTGTGDAGPNNHAAAHINVVAGNDIVADLVLDVRLLEEDPDDGSVATSVNVTVSSGVIEGQEVSVGAADDKYLDVTDVVVAGGTALDQLTLVSDISRVPAL